MKVFNGEPPAEHLWESLAPTDGDLTDEGAAAVAAAGILALAFTGHSLRGHLEACGDVTTRPETRPYTGE